jgi:hypothetical protein
LHRVISITGLPDVGTAARQGALDVHRFLEIRESPECEAFRQWLYSVDAQSDEEIAERLRSMRGRLSRLSRLLDGPAGRTVRFAVSTAAGFAPEVGAAAGLAVGAADSFIVDRLLRAPGPTSFLSDLYPSVFRAAWQPD